MRFELNTAAVVSFVGVIANVAIEAVVRFVADHPVLHGMLGDRRESTDSTRPSCWRVSGYGPHMQLAYAHISLDQQMSRRRLQGRQLKRQS